jgi:hypothetical protein
VDADLREMSASRRRPCEEGKVWFENSRGVRGSYCLSSNEDEGKDNMSDRFAALRSEVGREAQPAVAMRNPIWVAVSR